MLLNTSAKVHILKALIFLVIVYGYESWTVKKSESWRTDAFELWCWRRLLRVPWTARRSNQSILKEINHEYSLEELMLKLKLQYFGHLMGKDSSLENTLMLEKTWRQKGKGMAKDEMYKMLKASPTQWTCIWANSKDRKGQRNLVCYNPWSHKVLDMTWRLNNNMDFIYLANSILGGVYDLLIIT